MRLTWEVKFLTLGSLGKLGTDFDFQFDQNTAQCDQIGRFVALWVTFQSLCQQLFCPNRPHFYANFCKVVEIFNFACEIILGNFYRYLATFYWSHWYCSTCNKGLGMISGPPCNGSRSVTRFGEISPIWQKIKPLAICLVFGKILNPFWQIFMLLSQCLKNGKILKKYLSTVAKSSVLGNFCGFFTIWVNLRTDSGKFSIGKFSLMLKAKCWEII